MRPVPWVFLLVATMAACAARPYQDPAYAHLPHVNLVMVHHGGISLARTARDVRYEVESFLAENQIALACGPYDDGAPEFTLDLVDRGVIPGGDRRSFNFPLTSSPSGEPYGGIVSETPAESFDGPGADDARLLDGVVYMRRAHEKDVVLVGRVRGLVGYDFASSAKMAELIGALIRQGLSS